MKHEFTHVVYHSEHTMLNELRLRQDIGWEAIGFSVNTHKSIPGWLDFHVLYRRPVDA